MTMMRLVLHTGASGIMLYGFRSLDRLQIFPEVKAQYGGFWQYLTMQGLFLAGLTMVISLVLDIFGSPRILKHAKRLLLVIALPLSVVISSIYWTLILFFPSLILLKAKELADDSPSSRKMAELLFYIPLDMDLSLHAAPAVALVLDFFFFERKYGPNATRVVAPLLALVYTVGYGLWAEQCGTKNDGVFPYPFLTFNTFEVRVLIYAGAGLVAPLSFWSLNSLHT